MLVDPMIDSVAMVGCLSSNRFKTQPLLRKCGKMGKRRNCERAGMAEEELDGSEDVLGCLTRSVTHHCAKAGQVACITCIYRVTALSLKTAQHTGHVDT